MTADSGGVERVGEQCDVTSYRIVGVIPAELLCSERGVLGARFFNDFEPPRIVGSLQHAHRRNIDDLVANGRRYHDVALDPLGQLGTTDLGERDERARVDEYRPLVPLLERQGDD